MVTTVLRPRSGHRPLTLVLGLVCVALAADARAPLAMIASKPVAENEAGASQTAGHDEIVRLPKVIVRPPEDPIFNERELFSQKGLDELLRKRFPGASFKGQPAAMDNYARLIYSDVKRQESLERYQGMAKMLHEVGDFAESKELRKEIYDTLVRRPSWREEAMDRNLNSHRR